MILKKGKEEEYDVETVCGSQSPKYLPSALEHTQEVC